MKFQEQLMKARLVALGIAGAILLITYFIKHAKP